MTRSAAGREQPRAKRARSVFMARHGGTPEASATQGQRQADAERLLPEVIRKPSRRSNFQPLAQAPGWRFYGTAAERRATRKVNPLYFPLPLLWARRRCSPAPCRMISATRCRTTSSWGSTAQPRRWASCQHSFSTILAMSGSSRWINSDSLLMKGAPRCSAVAEKGRVSLWGRDHRWFWEFRQGYSEA